MKNSNGNDACTNLIQYFQLQRHMNLHQQRIKNVQPTLRGARQQTNRSVGHIKKQPLAQFNRIMTIDIQNKALLKKLTNKSPSSIGKEKPYKLIKNNRRKNFQQYRRGLQNQGLLKRIKQAKSSYQNGRYASQRKLTEGYINTISKFGYKNYAPNKTIMMPFYKRGQSRLTKVQNILQNLQPKSNYEDHQIAGNKQELDSIINIEKKSWNSLNFMAQITYVVWSKKLTVQIDAQGQDSMCLEIPKSVFSDLYHSQVRKVHKSIKYDQNIAQFYLDMPQKQKQKQN